MAKQYRAITSFGLEQQGLFVEGGEYEIEVAVLRPEGYEGPWMTPDREKELLQGGQIELVRKTASKGREVKDG